MRLYEFKYTAGYLIEDLNLICKQHKDNVWREPLPLFEFITTLLEGKKSKITNVQTPQNKPKTVVQKCELFEKTFDKKKREYPLIAQKLAEFLAVKEQNPIMQYGSSDKPFVSAGFYSHAIPKLRHAHLTHDISVFYTISGSDPVTLKLYGVFSHDESGTGTPANMRVQKSVAAQLKNQNFI